MKRTFFLSVFLLFYLFSVKAQTFYREYGSNTINEGAQVIIASPDGNILVGGYKADSALVMKLDPLGNVLWSKRFKPSAGYDNIIFHLTITPDNYVVGTGSAYDPSTGHRRDSFYFKLDLNGNLVWMRRVNDIREIYLQRIMPNSNTQYILIGGLYDSAPTYPDVFSARIDASNGNMTWMSPRLDYVSTHPYIDDVYSAAIGKNGSIYTSGRIYVNGSSPGGMRDYQSKFDNNGNLLFSKFIVHTYSDNARFYGIDIIYDNDSLVHCYFGDKYGSSSNFTVGLIKTDTLGNVIWSKDYDITSSSMEISQKVVKTNFGYAIFGYLNGTTKDFFLIATDHNGNPLWYKSYGTNSSDEDFRFTTTPVTTYAYGYLYFTGRKTSSGNQNIIIARTDSSGNISCATSINLNIIQTNNPTASTICPMDFPPDALSMPLASNSTLNTNLSDACSNYSVHLGNDTSICGSFNMILNATTIGATQYTWQNGSSAATLNATTAGTYWVNVQFGSCCFKSDTIVISNNNINTAITNNNPVICSGGSSTISASGGVSYSWNTGVTTSSIIVSPSSTTTYTVTVSTVSCTGTATATVTVNPAPSIYFSGNTMLCTGDIATLTSSGGINYSWSTGATTSSITAAATSTTTYSVVTSNANGCTATASVTVTVSPPPVASVSSATICSGQNTILTASGGGNYLWNTGATTAALAVAPAVTTTYSVIISIGSCADTANASVVVKPSPTAIAGNNVTISAGSSTSLSVSGGNSYSWNTGATTSSISVSPAVTTTYTVIVTDANGCTGIDSVIVFVLRDDCTFLQQAFFIPNVFTPNRDGENDVLKLFYNVKTSCIKEFEIAIYNRWGQKVFETTNISESWDGTFNGQKMNSAVFFYYCKVTSITDQKIVKKGNITILK